MVTNINLSAPEEKSQKKILTGKLTLALSIALVALPLLVFGTFIYFNSSYNTQAAQVEREINNEKSKMPAATYSGLFDFQERLTLLDGIIESHGYWDSFLMNFSQYILSDVRLEKLSFNKDDMSIIISGKATNFEVLSREIMLLRSYPAVNSVEFKGATGGGGSNGVSFDLSIKTNQSVLKK